MQVHYTEAGELQFLHGFQVVWVLVNLLQPVELHSQLSELLQRGDVGGCEGTPFRALNVDLAKKTSFGCCCLPSVLQGLRQGLGLPRPDHSSALCRRKARPQHCHQIGGSRYKIRGS